MTYLKQSILAALLMTVFTGLSLAQPATTAKTFRMYNDATHTVSITAGTAAGTGTFTWPQPAVGIFKSDITGLMSISPINLGTGSTDITGILNVINGGTGNSSVGLAGTVAFSDGTKLNYTAVGTTNQILISGGSGTPTWTNTLPGGTNVPFNLITTGTNTQATMTVGTGASIIPSGSGLIRATAFTGSGSTTDAVDLGTAEVNGTLGVGNGGTGNTVVGGAGTVAFSDGSKITYTAVGSTGQILQSNGAGAPTWVTATAARATGRTAIGAVSTLTVNAGVAISATTVITVTVETTGAADPNGTYTFGISNKTGTSFDVVFPFTLAAGDFVNWAVY